MFSKFFGETEEQQFLFLKKRIILTVALTVGFLLLGIANSELLPLGFSLSLIIWGWRSVKILFGISSLAALFSSNFIIGIGIFIFGIIIIPITGLLSLIAGVFRFIYLWVQRSNHG